jgi:hypothetical protein
MAYSSNTTALFCGENVSDVYRVNESVFNNDPKTWSCEDEFKIMSNLYKKMSANVQHEGVIDPSVLSEEEQTIWNTAFDDYKARMTNKYDCSSHYKTGHDSMYEAMLTDDIIMYNSDYNTLIDEFNQNSDYKKDSAAMRLFEDTACNAGFIDESEKAAADLSYDPTIKIDGKNVKVSDMSMPQLNEARVRIENKYGKDVPIEEWSRSDIYAYESCSEQFGKNMAEFTSSKAWEVMKDNPDHGFTDDYLRECGLDPDANPEKYGLTDDEISTLTTLDSRGPNMEERSELVRGVMTAQDEVTRCEIVTKDKEAKDARMESYKQQNIGYQIEAEKMAEAQREADRQAHAEASANAQFEAYQREADIQKQKAEELAKVHKNAAEQAAMPQTTPVETTPQTDTVETTVPQTSTPSMETKSAEAETSEATSPTVNSNGTVQATNKAKEEIQLTDEEFIASQTLMTVQGAYGNDKERHENLVKACVAQYGNGVDYNSLTDEQRKEYEAKADAIQANVNEKMKDSDYLHGRSDDFAKANEAKGKWSSKFTAMNKAAENESKNQGTEKQNQNDGVERG